MILLDNNLLDKCDFSSGDITYDFAKKSDTTALIHFMGKHPQAAFCEWQDKQFVNKALDFNAIIIIVSKLGRAIVGVAIAGIMGTRATINHIAVDPGHRKQRIGSQLVNRSLAEIKQRGVRRVFLFVDDDNIAAFSFWSKHGFKPTINETTMERDL
ncbi:MAG: GNAT family N-acetyltransferase [Pseudomonadota bacterium]